MAGKGKIGWFKACAGGCLLVVLLCVAAAWRVVIAPPRPPVLTPQEREKAVMETRTLQQEIAAIQRAGKAGKARPYRLVVTEQEINVFLQSDPRAVNALSSRKIRDAFVKLEPGVVHATATREVRGISVTASADLSPEQRSDGSLGCRVEAHGVSALGVTQTMVDRVANHILDAVNRYMLNAHLRYDRIGVEQGRIVLEGNTK